LSAAALSLVAWIYLWQTERILLAIGEPADLARDAGTYMRGYQRLSMEPAAQPSVHHRPLHLFRT
jgi:hypothetical protein